MIETIVYDVKNKNVIVSEGEAPKAALLESDDLFIWVNISKHPDDETRSILTKLFNFHPLTIEDCLIENHYPKIEEYDGYSFIILQAAVYHPKYNLDGIQNKTAVRSRDVQFYIGKNYLVTTSLKSVLSISDTIKHCEQNPHKTIGKGVDYLFYHIVDQMMKNYTPTIERFETKIDSIDENIFESIDANKLKEIFRFKKDIILLRRILFSQLEVISKITRDECPQISDSVAVYFRDIYDCLFRIIQSIDNCRDILYSVKDMFIALTSNNLNRTNLILAVLASIFLVPTLLSSYYGMNLLNLPLSDKPYGLAVVTLVMVILTLGLILFLKKKKWFL